MRIALVLLWLIHWLPIPVISGLARGLGFVAYFLATERRKVGLINLARCFPDMPLAERERIIRRHCQHLVDGQIGCVQEADGGRHVVVS